MAARDEGQDSLMFFLVFTGVPSFNCFADLYLGVPKPAQKRFFTITLQTLVGLFTRDQFKV